VDLPAREIGHANGVAKAVENVISRGDREIPALEEARKQRGAGREEGLNWLRTG